MVIYKDCKIIDVSSFSARISYLLDSINSERNGTGYFLADQVQANENDIEDYPQQLSKNILLDHSKIFQNFVSMTVIKQCYQRGKIFCYFSDDKDKDILQLCQDFYTQYPSVIPAKMSTEFIHLF